jgi:hypothetical protein
MAGMGKPSNSPLLTLGLWLPLLGAGAVLIASSGCGKGSSGSGSTADLAPPSDLGSPTDQAPPSDLAVPSDLATPPDLAPPVVALPSGCPSSATAANVYSIVQTSCAINSNCHGTSSSHFQIASVADVKTLWVNVNADQALVPFPRVTPSNVNRSYLLYKLVGQQNKVAPSPACGAQMPSGSTLTQAQICTFVAWVSSGAN